MNLFKPLMWAGILSLAGIFGEVTGKTARHYLFDSESPAQISTVSQGESLQNTQKQLPVQDVQVENPQLPTEDKRDDSYVSYRGLKTLNDFAQEIAIDSAMRMTRRYVDSKTDFRVNDFSRDTDEVLLARMLFGEARNCSTLERVAVAYTAINRTNDGKRWNGENVKEAILAPWQYSCFNENDPNLNRLRNPQANEEREAFYDCLQIARDVLSGKYQDPTNGATHYFNPNGANPSWAKKIEKVGRIQTENGLSQHEFYIEN